MTSKNNSSAWKAKYLALLEQQEALQASHDSKNKLLKRALFRSSLAAEGNDAALDQQLQSLRKLLHDEPDNAALEHHILLLEKAVLDYERSQQQHKDSISRNLHEMIEQLQQLQPGKDTRQALQTFKKDLSKQSVQGNHLANLLQQVKELQGRTLAATTQLESAATQPAAPRLLRRLFKTTAAPLIAKNTPVAEADPATTAPVPKLDSTTAAELSDHSLNTSSTAGAPQKSSASADATAATSPADSKLPDFAKVNYSALAEQIQAVLNKVLDELPASSQESKQMAELRRRINHGLHWYELPPLLDDMFAYMRTQSQSGEHELEQYLLQLNQHLVQFNDNLQSTSKNYRQSIENAQNLDNDLRQQVTHLHDDVQVSSDLAALKQQVASRLNNVMQRLQSYQEQQNVLNAKLLERFESLSVHAKQMEKESQSLSTQLEEQRQKALQDTLTGLPNRAAWNERFALEHARLQRNGSPLTLGIIDLDHFKQVNDSYGHLAGDKVLKIIATELKKRLRKTDFIARIGGEEYVVLLPDTPLPRGYEVMEKLRLAIQNCPFHFKGEPVTVTFSAGVGEVRADESMGNAFERIDQTLYIAKNAGRNSVRSADPLAADPTSMPNSEN